MIGLVNNQSFPAVRTKVTVDLLPNSRLRFSGSNQGPILYQPIESSGTAESICCSCFRMYGPCSKRPISRG